MAFAHQLAAVPHSIRYLALVGQFMAQWAALEATINHAIERAFGHTTTQGAILTPDMPFLKKIHILRTATDECVEEEPDAVTSAQCSKKLPSS
jgi:hypothetical protein